MDIKIALAADTALYVPIYRLQKVLREAGHKVEIENKQGDRNAYRALQHDAHFCVCDPLVIAQDSFQADSHSKLNGVVIASLVQKTGLWLVSTDRFIHELPDNETIISYSCAHPGSMKEVLSYTLDSTGGKVAQHLLKTHLGPCAASQAPCELGTEFAPFLAAAAVPADDISHDAIVTCDALTAFHLFEEVPNRSTGEKRVLFPLYKLKPYHSCLFTALLTSRTFLDRNREFVVDVLERLQEMLTDFYSDASVRAEFAATLTMDERITRLVGPGRPFSCQKISEHSEQVIEALYRDKLLAETIVVKKEQWEAAFALWYPHMASQDGLAREVFAKCVDARVAQLASHKKWLIKVRRYVRTNVRSEIEQALKAVGLIALIWKIPNFPLKENTQWFFGSAIGLWLVWFLLRRYRYV